MSGSTDLPIAGQPKLVDAAMDDYSASLSRGGAALRGLPSLLPIVKELLTFCSLKLPCSAWTSLPIQRVSNSGPYNGS